MTPRKLVTGVVMGLLLLSLTQPGYSQFARHHIGANLGYFKATSDDLKDEVLGLDVTNAVLGGFNYRYSFNSLVDLTVDSRLWTSSQEILQGVYITLTTSFFGVGMRFNTGPTAVRPYIQPTIYMASEDASGQAGGWRVETESESGVGLGVIGGVDIRVADFISIPLEANLLIAKPANNVSGFGFASGINFNFGRVKPKEEL